MKSWITSFFSSKYPSFEFSSYLTYISRQKLTIVTQDIESGGKNIPPLGLDVCEMNFDIIKRIEKTLNNTIISLHFLRLFFYFGWRLLPSWFSWISFWSTHLSSLWWLDFMKWPILARRISIQWLFFNFTLSLVTRWFVLLQLTSTFQSDCIACWGGLKLKSQMLMLLLLSFILGLPLLLHLSPKTCKSN